MIKTIKYFMAGGFLLGVMAGYGHAGILSGTADLVLGQPSFVVNSTVPPNSASLNGPQSVAFDNAQGRIYIADTFNNRILWWNNVSNLTNDKAADGVLGQVNFTSNLANQGGGGPDAGTLHYPSALCLDSTGRLWVADAGNNRILRFDSPTTKSTADFVLGQSNMTSNFEAVGRDKLDFPLGVTVDAAGNVWVVDENNTRVLGFTAATIASNSKQADIVIGQKDFDSKILSTSTVTPDTLYSPQGVFVDPSGNLWVADDYNNRFLRFSPPFTSGMSGDLVLGQADLYNTGLKKTNSQNRGAYANAGTINNALSITADRAGNIWVADFNNDRVLRYSGTLSSGMDAAQVVGQADFGSVKQNRGGEPGPNTLFRPNFVTVDAAGNLWVCEGRRFPDWHRGGNNRVLRFNTITVESIDPPQWHNAGSKTVTIRGADIAQGTTVKLARSGQNDIPGTGLSVAADESQMQATFDLTGVAAGKWDLAFTNGSFNVIVPEALTVLAVRIASVSPTTATNDNPVNMTINGESFSAGFVPQITKQGQAAINADNVVVVSSNQITCRFSILDATTGFWNVSVVPSPDATLPDAFDIHFPSSIARMILRANSYHLGMETTSGIFTFDFPQGTFSDDVFFTAAIPQRALPSVQEQEFKASAVAVEILNDKNLQPVKEIDIGFFYAEGLVAGLDHMKLVAAYFDEPTGRWIPVSSRAVGPGSMVMARTRHFCIYRLVQMVASTNLSGLKVYPNPYTPGTSDKYGNPMLGEGVVFSGLTGRARIRIFTVAGELVLQHDESDGAGAFVWDTKNDKGEKAASGVYIYYITDPDTGSEKQKGRFSIIR